MLLIVYAKSDRDRGTLLHSGAASSVALGLQGYHGEAGRAGGGVPAPTALASPLVRTGYIAPSKSGGGRQLARVSW